LGEKEPGEEKKTVKNQREIKSEDVEKGGPMKD